ncbi:uncharacterized protein LOC121772461 [Salvia splendens]|uniref:uncharacterized protein LOC121772461 n=1 Tax=Salvia splendens TaxID=180675 RepID=UPI001C25C25C|nr:uncharacterized protein LOC121772461 [Salvia splendens]
MGIGNNNEVSIHEQKSIFLPMFCRLSIKDVKLNTIPISAAAEPTSPRVSCIGQVKRNSRVTGYPSAAIKHPRPRKNTHFSTKTHLPAAGRKSGSRSCGRDSRGEVCGVKAELDISKMDPPLPVVKTEAAAAEVNLWKRRFDGVKSMHIQPIHLPPKKFQPPPPITV